MMQFGEFNKTNCPCKNCPDRHTGCHAECHDRYVPWKKAVDEQNAREREYHKSRDTISDEQKRKMWRKNRYQNVNRHGRKVLGE